MNNVKNFIYLNTILTNILHGGNMDLSILFNKADEKDFIRFPETLETYKWYKPIIIFILTAIIAFILNALVMVPIVGLHLDSAGSTVRESFFLLTLVLFIPALYISTRFIYKTSFSSQLTFGRKWNWKLYLISVAITLAVYVVYYLAMGAASEMNLSKVSAISILLFIILPIFQAFAEEYIFRGFLMQTLGSWFKIPIVAIIIQAVLFGLIHFQYNVTGMVGVLISGIIYGFVTWYTKGLEISSALHAVNNLTAFLAILFSFMSSTGSISSMGFVVSLALLIVPTCIILALNKKFNLVSSDGN